MAGRVRPAACLMMLMLGAAPAAASEAEAAAPAIALPDVIDLGAVPRGRAQCMTGRLELHAARQEAGATLLLSCRDPRVEVRAPQLPLRAGRTACNFRLSVDDRGTGPQACSLDATLERGDERIELGALPVRWRVYDSAVLIRNWRAPEVLHTASEEVTARIEIQATPDLARKPLAVRVRFDDLPPGMEVDVSSPAVTLRGGAQAFDVRLSLRGLRRGRFEGSLELVPPDGAQAPEPTPLVLAVEATAVRAALHGEGGDLRANGERWLHLELTAAGLQEPAVLELALDREGLPDGVRVELPRRLRIVPGEDSTLVPVRVIAGRSPSAGAWTPVIRVIPRTPGVIAVPGTLPLALTARTPLVRSLAWLVLAAAGMLLAALRFRGTLRRPVRVPRALAGGRA